MVEFSEVLHAQDDNLPDFSTPQKILEYAKAHSASYILVHAAYEAIVRIILTNEGAEDDPEIISIWDELTVLDARAKLLNGVPDSTLA